MQLIEEKLSVPVIGECDVLVAGGGFAGISAALSAARQGKNVLLVENEFALGGLGTLGIVTIYLPLCDGEGHQVIYGIGEELLRLSVKYGAEDGLPGPWLYGGTTEEKKEKRFDVRYNPNMFVLEAEKLLLDSGVKILYGSKICSVKMNGSRISHIIVENKSGRSAYQVGTVVDCTGDADVAKLSGAETADFEQGNVLAGWYYYLSGAKKQLCALGAADIPDEDKKKGVSSPQEMLIGRRFCGLDGEELSAQMQFSHEQTLNDFKKRFEKDNSTEITLLATIPQIRMTRRIVGDATMDTADDKRYFEDSIGLAGNWKKRGPIYEIPFGAIKSVNVSNLLAAGRCISTTDAMWDVTRVIPVCAVTGEAAGMAAAMFDDFNNVDIPALQARLRVAGVKIHVNEVIK